VDGEISLAQILVTLADLTSVTLLEMELAVSNL
jgi:hypothetical protein